MIPPRRRRANPPEERCGCAECEALAAGYPGGPGFPDSAGYSEGTGFSAGTAFSDGTGADPVKGVANERPDVDYLGAYSAWIELANGAYLHLLHGKGGIGGGGGPLRCDGGGARGALPRGA